LLSARTRQCVPCSRPSRASPFSSWRRRR
jgi:hypothetical protein